MSQAEMFMDTKVCIACDKELPLSQYYDNKSNSKDGKKPRCIPCYQKQMAEYKRSEMYRQTASYQRQLNGEYNKSIRNAKKQLTRSESTHTEEPKQELALRYNTGKPDYSLIPLHLLEGAVRVMASGAEKYSAWNWAKGMPWSTPYACAMRHIAAWYKGETNDSETGENHIDHAICNLLMLKHFADSYKEGDDRPTLF